jgi:hypothetical protein
MAWHGMAWHGMAWHGMAHTRTPPVAFHNSGVLPFDKNKPSRTTQDLASRDAIDKNAPNPKFCQRYGASTLVLDHRIFVSFNPFSIYVTQADVKPGCVLRAANVVQVLQGRGLLTDDEVSARGGLRVGGGWGGEKGERNLGKLLTLSSFPFSSNDDISR